MSTEYHLNLLRDTLAVSRSGYHAWASRQPGPRAQADLVLVPLITQAHDESRQFATRAEAKAAIFEWIEVFYNRTRFHSALGYQSPVDFETNLN
jgi:Integrase core domain